MEDNILDENVSDENVSDENVSDENVSNKKVLEESILLSIKKLLGVSADYEVFDPDIVMHINTVFMVLNQLGVGPSTGFRIEDATKKWSEYISDEDDLEAVKTYMHLKVKLVFDPPLSSAAIEAIKQSINEFEWRLNVQAESK